jgi:hypothetical protein
VIAIAAIVLALTNLPYLWGSIIDFEGQVFSGFVYTFTFYDILSYLAKMRDGFDGGWFYTNPFTTEDVKPVFLFIFYIALGHLARLTGLSLVVAYHLSRVALGVFLLAAVDRMIRRFPWHGPTRLLAYALVFFGGGFGGLLHWSGIEPVPLEFMQTEAFVFQSMLSYPHFVLTLALMVWMLTDAWQLGRGERRAVSLAASAVAAFVLAWVHPRPLLTVVLVSLLAAFWGGSRKFWTLRPWAIFVFVVLVAAMGPMLVSLITVRADPMWTEWSKTETLSASPWKYLVAYGLLWPLALMGLTRAARREEPWAPLLGSWLIVGSLLPFVPIAAQGRLVIGWNIPLALLAGYALGEMVLPGIPRGPAILARATPALTALLIVILSLSALAYLGLGVRRVLVGSFPGYYSQDRAEAMAWLEANTNPEDPVLASVLSGMFIPAFAGNRVVQGHWAETFDPEIKAKKIGRIFDASTSGEHRAELLEELRVRYLLYGQWEREMGAYDPGADSARWTLRWQGAAASIFEWEREP